MGGYILTGHKTIRLNADGSIRWIDDLIGLKVHQLSSGNYIVCNVDNNVLSFVTLLNSDGSIQWQKSYADLSGGTHESYFIYDVCEAYPGGTGYIACGLYNNAEPEFDGFISAVDNDGTVVDPVTTPCESGLLRTVCKNGGNYLTAGYDRYRRKNLNCVAEYDGTNIIWDNRARKNIAFVDVAPTLDSGSIAFGSDSIPGDVIAIRYDKSGNQVWEKNIIGSAQTNAGSVIQCYNGNYLVCGSTLSNGGDIIGNHGGNDGWAMVFGTNVGINNLPNNSADVAIYPIPASDQLHINLPIGYTNAILKLTDISGRAVVVKEDVNNTIRTLHIEDLAAGVYILQVTNNGVSKTCKVVHH